jgi:uncharacterized membrane protein YhaH (DUF805 family)
MWTRKSVKQKGKTSFYSNFWKCVLVALILSVVIGANSQGSSFSSMASNGGQIFGQAINEEVQDENDGDITDGDHSVNVEIDYDDDGNPDITFDSDSGSTNDEIPLVAMIVIGLIVFIISLFIMAIGLAVRYLLLVPFEYGCRKFFRKNLDEPAKLSNIVYVFDSHYKNVIKTAFMTDLFIYLWSLLFIIPGIIKTYEYRLVPYIVSENPTISFKEAQAESAKLMKGNKWKSFILDLSFIGWDLLSLCTFGLLEIFFVGPYKASTDAALYESLKYGIDAK